jgi:hypothetical protein
MKLECTLPMGEVALQVNSHGRRKSKARGAASAVLPSVRHDLAETKQSKGWKKKISGNASSGRC